MLRELPFKTIGDVGGHGLELHVYRPSCYATRLVTTDDARWRDRLVGTARFRFTGQRYTGRPCAGPCVPKVRPRELLQVGGLVTLAFLCAPAASGKSTKPARQAAMVRYRANSIAVLAAVAASSGTYMAQRSGRERLSSTPTASPACGLPDIMASVTSIANVTATLAPTYQSIMSSQIVTARSAH